MRDQDGGSGTELVESDSRALAVRSSSGPNPLLLRARFPTELNDPIALHQFVQACVATGLNPLLGECVPLHGHFYVEEQGWLQLIETRRPGQKVRDDVRLGTKEEAQALGIQASGWLAFAEVDRLHPGGSRPVTYHDTAFLSWTRVRSADSRLAFLRDEPWRQALKIARVRCLRRAFPDVLVAIEPTRPTDVPALTEGVPVVATDDIEEQLAALEATESARDTMVTERRRFFARLREFGIKSHSEEMKLLLQLPESGSGSMREHWLPSRSWFDANERVDRLEVVLRENGGDFEQALQILSQEPLPVIKGERVKDADE